MRDFETTTRLRDAGAAGVAVRDVTAQAHADDCPRLSHPMHLDLPSFLVGRHGYYDTIWIARTHNLDRVREAIDRAVALADRPPRVILDTEAIASQRDAMRAALSDKPGSFDLASALRQEFANAAVCDQVVAVSAQDASTLHELGLPRVAIIGHMREPTPTRRGFTQRAGLLFVGAIHTLDSPNYDGLGWLVDQVLPLIERALQWEARLTVVGYTGEEVSLDRFRHHPRVTLLGAVVHTECLYDTHRVFVAPTRFAAGTPYKVHEAASFGLPVVATDLYQSALTLTLRGVPNPSALRFDSPGAILAQGGIG